MKYNIFSVIIALLVSQASFSQNEQILATRINSVQEGYASANVGGIVSGKIYSLKYLHAINSQFYKDAYPAIGTMVYDGVFFPSIEIQYDLYIQKIIVLIESKNSKRYVSIDTEKVSEFTIDQYQFTHIRTDSIMKDGIYELAFLGLNSQILIKRSKERRERTKDGKNVLVFSDDNRYYIKNRYGTFHITNKKSFFRAYNNSDDVKRLVKENKIKLSRMKFENGVVTTVTLLEPK